MRAFARSWGSSEVGQRVHTGRMTELNALPEWVGTAIIGAVLASLGFLGTRLIDWISAIRAERRARRARLVDLLALLRAGDVAFKIQSENRNRLLARLERRAPELRKRAWGFDKIFARTYPSMTPAELDLHAVVRTITMHTLQPLNEGLLAWLQADHEFKVHRPGKGDRARLATYLADLEAHLLLWRSKYQAWIPTHPERALVYLADERRHGLPFPDGGTDLVGKLLGVHAKRADQEPESDEDGEGTG
jgi:hypothetical protein